MHFCTIDLAEAADKFAVALGVDFLACFESIEVRYIVESTV